MPVENQKRDLVVTRVIDASVGQVWRAWTDPQQILELSKAGLEQVLDKLATSLE